MLQAMTTVFLAIFLIAIAFILLGVKVLFVKGAKFPSGHVHDSAALRRKGISCASESSDSHINYYKNNKIKP